MTGPVLLIEDDDALRTSLAQTLELAGLTPLPMSGFVQARRSIRANFAGVILSDIRMPYQDGFDVLRAAHSVDRDLPVILMTGHSDVPTAMRAMKQGAYDYLEKPCSTDRVTEVVRRALEHRTLVLKARRIERALLRSDAAAAAFPGDSPATAALCDALRKVAATRCHVHLHGPDGSGKKQAAFAINQLAAEPCPFLRINFRTTGAAALAALRLPEGPVDLSCRHVDAATPQQQGALLDLAAGHGGLRLLTAAAGPLSAMPGQGLVDALDPAQQIIEIAVPGLAERRGDLGVIFEGLLRQTARSLDMDMPEIPPDALSDIAARPWPGNLTELRAHAVSFALGSGLSSGPAAGQSLAEQMDAFERQVLVETLRRTEGRAAEAARLLGLPRNTLYDRLARHDIQPRGFRKTDDGG